MAKTLTEIQTLVRFLARDEGILLTDATGLAVTNMVYSRMVEGLRFPEFIRNDESLTTVADQEAYTWPTTVIFTEVIDITVQDPSHNLRYRVVPSPPNDFEWARIRGSQPAFPLMHLRLQTSGVDQLLLSPAPHVTGLTIRIHGHVEPADLTAGSSTTIIIQRDADNALAHLIAASFLDKRNDKPLADHHRLLAEGILKPLAKKEGTRGERDGSRGLD